MKMIFGNYWMLINCLKMIKERLEEFKQYAKDNGFEDYDEAYLYWKGFLK